MQYTPQSMGGMLNMSAEIAAADGYSKTIRLFTVGMKGGGWNAKGKQLPLANGTTANGTLVVPCSGKESCRTDWSPAAAGILGGDAWDSFSAVCWLFGRDVHDGLQGKVPIGLISSNYGGTPIEDWVPVHTFASLNQPHVRLSLSRTLHAG
jgi:sialate O-acetylesterase